MRSGRQNVLPNSRRSWKRWSRSVTPGTRSSTLPALSGSFDQDQRRPADRPAPIAQTAGEEAPMSISGKTDPVVRPIATADVAEALVEGLRDFQAMPLYGLVFGALYAAGGILIVLSLTAFGM